MYYYAGFMLPAIFLEVLPEEFPDFEINSFSSNKQNILFISGFGCIYFKWTLLLKGHNHIGTVLRDLAWADMIAFSFLSLQVL